MEIQTFESFVTDGDAGLAHDVAQAFCNRTAGEYNPLVLAGPPGTGKTHLLNAIAHEHRRRNPEGLRFLDAGEVVERLIQGIRRDASPGRTSNFPCCPLRMPGSR